MRVILMLRSRRSGELVFLFSCLHMHSERKGSDGSSGFAAFSGVARLKRSDV